jgi:hypothetical protein
MRVSQWLPIAVLFTIVLVTGSGAALAQPNIEDSLSAKVNLVRPPEPADSCSLAEVTSNPTRPNWDTSATTTQCGVVEIDAGWLDQPMGTGVRQTLILTSMRYGLTPKLDLRWGLTNHMTQSGGGTAPLEGVGDQWLMARYRLLDQNSKLPALAFLYGIKIPTANPAKGFGSGFADHQFTWIASRDLGKNHFDFNAVGTVVGEPGKHDGAVQCGLALTRTITPKISWMLESYGGPQPGTRDRFGAAFTGASYTVRPTLVVDLAYARTYTAGSPREQIMFGFTYAMRSVFPSLSKGSAIARLMGR